MSIDNFNYEISNLHLIHEFGLFLILIVINEYKQFHYFIIFKFIRIKNYEY